MNKAQLKKLENDHWAAADKLRAQSTGATSQSVSLREMR